MEAQSVDKQTDFEAIVGQIARAHGTTPQEVRLSMQQALDEGRGNPDPAVQSAWHSIPSAGGTPTLDEVIAFLVKRLRQQTNPD